MALLDLSSIAKLSSEAALPIDANNLTQNFLEEMGVNIINQKERSFLINFDRFYIVIVPRIFPEGISRTCQLNAHINYRGRGRENLDSLELLKLLNEINSRFTALKIEIDDEGDFTISYTLCFDYKIESKLILKWLQDITNNTRVLLSDFEEKLAPYYPERSKE